jgi:hypothetical protein
MAAAARDLGSDEAATPLLLLSLLFTSNAAALISWSLKERGNEAALQEVEKKRREGLQQEPARAERK